AGGGADRAAQRPRRGPRTGGRGHGHRQRAAQRRRPLGASMRLIHLTLLGLALLAGQAGAAEGRLQQLEFAGQQRSYKLFVPNGAGKEPLPLMIVMHGGLGNADETERTTGMNRVAQANRFLVAYPNG